MSWQEFRAYLYVAWALAFAREQKAKGQTGRRFVVLREQVQGMLSPTKAPVTFDSTSRTYCVETKKPNPSHAAAVRLRKKLNRYFNAKQREQPLVLAELFPDDRNWLHDEAHVATETIPFRGYVDLRPGTTTACFTIADQRPPQRQESTPRPDIAVHSGQKLLFVLGSGRLSHELWSFAEALGHALIKETNFVLLTGGRHSEGEVGRHLDEHLILKGARAALRERGQLEEERLVTLLPREHAPGLHFVAGRVEYFEKDRAHRKALIEAADVVTSIEGHTSRRYLHEAANVDKPVLPLPFTGGASNDEWATLEPASRHAFKLDADDIAILTGRTKHSARGRATKIAQILSRRQERTVGLAIPIGHPLGEFEKNLSSKLEGAGFTLAPIEIADLNIIDLTLTDNIARLIANTHVALLQEDRTLLLAHVRDPKQPLKHLPKELAERVTILYQDTEALLTMLLNEVRRRFRRRR